ncbi:MAG: T9SS type A sorting domain-containing protein [Saprospiraceae bacterium]
MINKLFMTSIYILLVINTLSAQNPIYEVWEIQGDELFTPYLNQTVETKENVVTAVGDDFFFIQTPTYRSDNNQATSDGIIILTNNTPPVEVGNLVSISGTVRESFQRTQMDEADGMTITIDSINVTLPIPVILTENFPSPDNVAIPDLEKVEGMLVSFPQAITNSPTNQYGETSVRVGSTRAFREPGIESPAPGSLPEFDGNPEVFEVKLGGLDLPNSDQSWARMNIAATGVMNFAFDDYLLLATDYEITGQAPLFGVDEPNNTQATIGCVNIRGLSNLETEYATRRLKVEKYIVDLMQAPDIVALQEIRSLAVLEDIATLIQENNPDLIYTPYLIPNGDNGSWVINLGYLVKNTVSDIQITRLGVDEQLSNGGRVHDRPPLILEGSFNSSPPQPISILNLHLRSLGGITQTSTKQKRHQAAMSVAQMVEDRIDENLFVVGDFNAFQFSDGYVDVVNQIAGTPSLGAEYPVENIVSSPLTNQGLTLPVEEQYSYVFQNNAQILDHCLTNDLQGFTVNKMQYVRGNADFSADFESQFPPLYRTSDHDGFVVFLDLNSELTTPVNTLLENNFAFDFPNPFSSNDLITLNLEQSEAIQISLVNFDGKIIYEKNLGKLPEGKNSINIPLQIPNGTYFLQVNGEKNNQTKPLIFISK